MGRHDRKKSVSILTFSCLIPLPASLTVHSEVPNSKQRLLVVLIRDLVVPGSLDASAWGSIDGADGRGAADGNLSGPCCARQWR